MEKYEFGDIDTIGKQLHEAEWSIHLGRQALVDVLSVEPIDQEAIELHRAEIRQSRMERNILRRQLQQTKEGSELPLVSWNWY